MQERAIRPLSEDQRRSLRHALRTQVNNITSYTELLLYDAEADGETDFANELKTIREDGQRSLAIIDRIVDGGAPGASTVHADIASITALMESIRGRVWRLAAYDYAADEQLARDLERIAGGAQRLVALVQPDVA